MSSKLALGFLFLAVGWNVPAQTVLEKRAIKEGDEAIAKAVAKFKQDCGAKGLNVSSNHASAGKLKYENEASNVLIASSGAKCAEAIETIAYHCTSDKMNKEEMSKLTGVNCTYRIIEKRPFWIANKKGSVLNVEMHPIRISGNENYDVILGAF